MAAGSTPRRLVADIGGTNSRLALFDPVSGELGALRHYANAQYGGIEEVIAAWLAALDGPPPEEACMAVAAPPFDDRVVMLNIDWSFSCRALREQFRFDRLACINDFEANARALPQLTANDLATLHAGSGRAKGRFATLGPGTGLGGCTLDCRGAEPLVCASEPGHMGLAPATLLELELFRLLLPRHGEIHAELLVSGPGLRRLYLALAEIRGLAVQPLDAPEITRRAEALKCPVCEEALQLFCALLGSICGDYVLATGAYDGLYLAGGIAPRIIPLLETSTFRQRFAAKGNMAEHLARVPLHVITCPVTGLLGAAHTPLA